MKKELVKLLAEVLAEEEKDSLEWGAASKDGKCKIYYDFTDIEETTKRIDAANKLRDYANGVGGYKGEPIKD